MPGAGPPDPPRVVTVEVEPDRAVVHFETRVGQRYGVERSTALSSDSWTEIQGNLSGTGATRAVTDWFTGNRAFYRVRCAGAPMVLIPGGEFTMGKAIGPPSEGFDSELPLHTVMVSAFHVDAYEVTKALWDEVTAWASGHGYDISPADGSGVGPDHPVLEVTWWEVVKFCNARSELEGLVPCYRTTSNGTVFRTGTADPACDFSVGGYRLPTEAEWEKAARGGTPGHRFPWADVETISHAQANYYSHWSYDYDVSPTRHHHPVWDDNTMPYTATVGWFAPNGFGLYDMAGNVWEWCWDWLDWGYYATSPATDPAGPSTGLVRVVRGGAWDAYAGSVRVSDRPGLLPEASQTNLGFRCVRRLTGN